MAAAGIGLSAIEYGVAVGQILLKEVLPNSFVHFLTRVDSDGFVVEVACEHIGNLGRAGRRAVRVVIHADGVAAGFHQVGYGRLLGSR